MDPQDNQPVPALRSERTAVLLIAHGSRQPSANDDLHELAARLSAAGEHPIVEACFLELADPDISTGGCRCVDRGATVVLMVPYFLSAGVHLRRDLTAARDELSHRYPDIDFRLGSPLGPHPLLDSLVAARIQELKEAISRSQTDPSRATVDSVAVLALNRREKSRTVSSQPARFPMAITIEATFEKWRPRTRSAA